MSLLLVICNISGPSSSSSSSSSLLSSSSSASTLRTVFIFTIGLDAESEHLIHEALSEISKERTVLMISHRLKTVQSCDLILVLDGGRIVESGSHDELIHKPGGTYANLVKRQSILQGSKN